MSEMKARHWAALSTFIILIASIAIVSVVSTLKDDPKPEKIGSFEFEGTKTEVIKSGGCAVFMTKWPNQPEPRFFFNCNDGKK
jgi:hypothetical protein